MNSKILTLSPLLRFAIAVAAALDLLIGLAFLLGPEWGITLWPSPIPRELMRFIGAIVLANGIGAAMIVRKPTWENARVLIAVALVYGILVFFGLIVDLLTTDIPRIFWLYAIFDGIFSFPAAYFFWRYEHTRSPDPAREVFSNAM